MFSTAFKLVLLLSVVGLAAATFVGSSSCGIQIHRASGLVLWCEAQGLIFSQNITMYVAPMNATSNRVAIYNFQHSILIMSTSSTTATPYLDTDSGQIMIVTSTSTGVFPGPYTTIFHILGGSIHDLKNWTTVYTQAAATETLGDVQMWVNGVFLFATMDTSLNNSVSYKAFVPNNNNGFSFVEIFPYSANIVHSNVQGWVMDGTSRLCLSVVADECSIICRSLTNTSTELVIHSDSNELTFAALVSDNNGRIFWAEFNGTASLRIWAANSAKTDTPAVIDRTTNTTYVTLVGITSSVLTLGYDSYNKLVYWTENIAIVPEPSANDFSFGVFGWDGKTSAGAVVNYFAAENVSTTINGPICTYNGQMMLTSEIGGGLLITGNTTGHLFHTSPASSGAPPTLTLFTHIFQDISSSLSLVCDPKTGWAVAAFKDVAGLVGSSISAIRIDNTTSMSVEFSANVTITLGASVTLTDGVIGYTLENAVLGTYDLLFYTLPSDEDNTGAPPVSDSPAGGNNPNTNSPSTGPSVSFANQLAPFAYFASLAYLFF